MLSAALNTPRSNLSLCYTTPSSLHQTYQPPFRDLSMRDCRSAEHLIVTDRVDRTPILQHPAVPMLTLLVHADICLFLSSHHGPEPRRTETDPIRLLALGRRSLANP
jgi:hypothetical protein